MPKLIVSIDGVIVKEVQLTKDRTTIGRRPYNDVVIDNLAVSGEHAIVQMSGDEATVEDLNSTNGTHVNGKAVRKQVLAHDDTIEVGKYKIKYLTGSEGAPSRLGAPPSGLGAGASVPMGFEAGTTPSTGAAQIQSRGPRVRVLTGGAAGRELELTKIVTTLGKPGVAVVSITRKAHGFDVALVEGSPPPTVNGVPLDGGLITLTNRDQIELAGMRMEFLDS